ncbi:MAG TPA: type II toxin-antitoxin system HicB family antitoxin [Piscirickettsiaceae bacterium]|nr:type II toxin-antitoxin system HicB family antitoxin [Piscirickettsiaceae bacterium]
MDYPLVLEPEGDAWLVDFVDVPEAHTVVYDLNAPQKAALDAFDSALELYTETKRPIPLPSSKQHGQQALYVPTTVAAKIHLYNEWLRSGLSKRELAERMGVKPPALIRLFNFRYRSRVESIEAALDALGKHLEIAVT